MCTWSVMGTPLAFWTSSSSLSISTSTSTALSSSLERPAGVQLREALRDGLGDVVVHRAAEGRDLPHAARREKTVLRGAHHVERLDLGRQAAVQVVHLELPLEV